MKRKFALDQLFPVDRTAPMVRLLDGHPPWSSPPASTGCAAPTFGVSRFGQVRSLDDVYRYYGNDTDNNVTAALDILP